jgi:hypothetical protein
MWIRQRAEVFLIILIVLCISCTEPFPKSLPKGKTMNAQVTLQRPARAIPGNIVGFSIELTQLCTLLQEDATNTAPYEQLFKNLGSSTLRIGGYSADSSVWEPDGGMPCDMAQPVVTKTLIDRLFAFAQRIHWNVIWTLNLNANDPQTAADEAKAVAAVGGIALVGFSIGNEPELYVTKGLRLAQWGFANYQYEWEQYRDAILRMVPSANFIGPDVCCSTLFISHFLKTDDGKAISALSSHYYISSSKVSIGFILSKSSAKRFVSMASQWITLAHSVDRPLYITESNTLSLGGALGTSNTLGAAIWASDYLLQAAAIGIQQVDFHSGPQAFYDAISDAGVPTPLYYSLLLVHLVTRQAMMVPVSVQTTLNLTAYATIDASGLLSIILINKDLNTNALVDINPGRVEKVATLIRLEAASIAATSGITLGGRAVSAQGIWTPVSKVLPFQGTTLALYVAAGSVAVVTFHP